MGVGSGKDLGGANATDSVPASPQYKWYPVLLKIEGLLRRSSNTANRRQHWCCSSFRHDIKWLMTVITDQ